MAKKLFLEQLIERFQGVHGNNYDYSLITSDNYVNTQHPVPIRCKKCGNVFKQIPCVHLIGCGCRVCANDRIRKSKKGVGRSDMRRAIYGVGICDVESSVFLEDGSIMPSYNIWHDMLKRCYSEMLHKKEPAYIGCSVCDEWKRFSIFKDWFEENYVEGYALDKDILIKGNKIYSPTTCCFIPRELNSLLTNRRNHRGECPIGVTKASKSNNYEAALFINGERVYLGTFKSKEEAFEAYKVAKEAHIKEVAQKYYYDGKISERVRDALIKYKVEITD